MLWNMQQVLHCVSVVPGASRVTSWGIETRVSTKLTLQSVNLGLLVRGSKNVNQKEELPVRPTPYMVFNSY